VNPRFATGSEFAMRAHRLIGNAEVALYFYDGFWKSPAGQTMDGIPTFPKLQVPVGVNRVLPGSCIQKSGTIRVKKIAMGWIP
jgi:hypothetical protein